MSFERAPAADDPQWPRASAWLTGETTADPGPSEDAPRLHVVGVPSSVGSISQSEAWSTPPAVREALRRLGTWDPVTGTELGAGVVAVDHGDWDLIDLALVPAVERIQQLAAQLDPTDGTHLFLGGDNAITRPVVAGLHGPDLSRVGVITLDAHHDVRHLDDGPRNGSPIRGLVAQDGLPGSNVVQLGIGRFTNSHAYASWCQQHDISVVTIDQLHAGGGVAAVTTAVDRALDHLDDVDSIHVDLDVDVLDAAFAPACPGARPGGLLPGQLFAAAERLAADPRVRSLDLVEVDAAADVGGRTVMATAMAMLHVAVGLIRR